MRTGEACNRTVVMAEVGTGIVEAAQRMREHHVGTLVVVREDGDAPHPVGIVTDRDVVIEVVAKRAPIDTLTVADIMTRELVSCDEDEDLLLAFDRMRHKGIRRMPVVNRRGALVGLLAVDDVIELLAELIARVPKLVQREQQVEMRNRP